MDKRKVLLVSAVIMVIAGLALMSRGYSMGAHSVVLFGDEDTDEVVSGSVDISEFDTLTIDVEDLDVYLQEGDEYRFDYWADKRSQPEVTQDGKKLTIKENRIKKVTIGILDIRLGNSKEPEYRITVPRDSAPVNVNIKNNSECVNISGVDINGSVVADDDEIFIEDITSDNLVVKASDENVRLRNVKLGTADIEAYNDVKIDIDGKNEYSYDLQTGSSDDIVVAGVTSTKESFKFENSTSDKSITAKSSSGDITITFSEG